MPTSPRRHFRSALLLPPLGSARRPSASLSVRPSVHPSPPTSLVANFPRPNAKPDAIRESINPSLVNQSHGVLARPLLCQLGVSVGIRLVDLRNLRDERVVGVGIGEERADGQEHLGDGERGRPLLLEDVQAVLPWLLTLGWYTFVLKFTLGGLNG